MEIGKQLAQMKHKLARQQRVIVQALFLMAFCAAGAVIVGLRLLPTSDPAELQFPALYRTSWNVAASMAWDSQFIAILYSVPLTLFIATSIGHINDRSPHYLESARRVMTSYVVSATNFISGTIFIFLLPAATNSASAILNSVFCVGGALLCASFFVLHRSAPELSALSLEKNQTRYHQLQQLPELFPGQTVSRSLLALLALLLVVPLIVTAHLYAAQNVATATLTGALLLIPTVLLVVTAIDVKARGISWFSCPNMPALLVIPLSIVPAFTIEVVNSPLQALVMCAVSTTIAAGVLHYGYRSGLIEHHAYLQRSREVAALEDSIAVQQLQLGLSASQDNEPSFHKTESYSRKEPTQTADELAPTTRSIAILVASQLLAALLFVGLQRGFRAAWHVVTTRRG